MAYHVVGGEWHAFSETRFDHPDEGLNVARPGDDVRSACPRVGDDDNGPIKSEKGIEGGEEVTPTPVVPVRRWPISHSQKQFACQELTKVS